MSKNISTCDDTSPNAFLLGLGRYYHFPGSFDRVLRGRLLCGDALTWEAESSSRFGQLVDAGAVLACRGATGTRGRIMAYPQCCYPPCPLKGSSRWTGQGWHVASLVVTTTPLFIWKSGSAVCAAASDHAFKKRGKGGDRKKRLAALVDAHPVAGLGGDFDVFVGATERRPPCAPSGPVGP